MRQLSGTGAASLGFGMFCGVGSLVMLAISVSTDHWLDVRVDGLGAADNTNVATKAEYNSYSRGLYRVCFKELAVFLQTASFEKHVKDHACIYEEIITNPAAVNTARWSSDAMSRMHLMRGQLALICLGIILSFVAIILCARACCSVQKPVLALAIVLALLALLCSAGGMGCFHGLRYLENNKILDVLFPIPPEKYWMETTSYASLKAARTVSYGYSYMLGWASVGTTFLSTLFYAIAYVTVPSDGRRRKHKEFVGDWVDKSAYGQPPWAAYNAGYPY